MTSIFPAEVSVEGLQQLGAHTLAERLGIQFTEVGDDYLRAVMPVDHRTCQPMRILHGGASVAMAETLASVAANLLVDRAKWRCVGQEINANHLRPAPEGTVVTATARPFHIGARSQVWGIEMCNALGQRICVSRITMAVIPV